MLAEGRMTDAGLALVNQAKASGVWGGKRTHPSLPTRQLPAELWDVLEAHPKVAETFHSLSPTYQRQYISWIATAKRTETRQRRTREAIEQLKRGEQLGLK